MSNPADKSNRERAIFEAALDIASAEGRLGYLKGACGKDAALLARVQALLQAHEAPEGFLPEQPKDGATIRIVTEKAGDKIGHYKLLEQIGEGGCGVVYMAEQVEPIRRRVALKVIKLGMDTKHVIARFEAERQALALMDHPNIAKVLDAGATDTGRPYFVMELVRGIKITEYCDENCLSTEERLNLFVQVCHAIQHAHQKGVIHRDIKPSNILVTLNDGVRVPKVIDFGIAKAIGQQLTDKTVFTSFEQFIGTPAYMSPEQAVMTSLDVDTRSDIYALGVLLYELLTGHTPFEQKELIDAGLDAMRRIIREREPARPSTRLSTLADPEQTTVARRRSSEPPQLIHLLRGDLDWIVMRCLEKDRTRRYETANGLADDLLRHLNNEPVAARPPSTVYRAQKFIRRHKVIVGAAAVVASVLVLGILVSAWQAVRARSAEQRAEAEAGLARQAEKTAQEAAQAVRRSLYLADMNGAQLALKENNLGHAVELVNKYFPKPGEPDLRGIEWRYLWNLCQGDESFVLDFHGYPVNAAACSPDGKIAALASFDNKVTVVERDSKQVLARLNGFFNTQNAQALAFSPDGKLLAAADRHAINLWRTDSWGLAGRLEGECFLGDSITVVFSPDGKTVTTACAGKLGFWNDTTAQPSALVSTEAPSISHGHRLAYAPDGQTLAYSAADGIRLWDVRSGSWSERFAGQLNAVLSLAWSSNWLAGAGYFGDFKMWDMRTGREVVNLKPWQTALAFSPDGQSLASAGGSQKIHLWDVAALDRAVADSSTLGVSPNLPKTATLQGHRNMVWTLAYSPDGKALVTGSADGSARFWGSLRPRETTSLEGARVPLSFSNDGRSLLALSADHTLAEWDVHSLQKTRVIDLSLNTNEIQSVAMAPDGRTLAAGTTNGTVELLSLETRQRFAQKRFGEDPVIKLGFSPKGNLLVVQSSGPMSGPEPRQRPLVRIGHRQQLSLPSSRLIIWNPASGETFGPFGRVCGFACSPDETQLAFTTPDFELRIWDIGTAKLRVTLKGHSSFVYAASFSPDGKLLATASLDTTIRLWDTSSWSELAVLRGHMGAVISAAFSSDGKMLVSAGSDPIVKFWDVDTRQELLSSSILPGSFSIVSGEPWKIMLSPDKSALAIQMRQFHGSYSDSLLFRAPTFAEIEERQKSNAAARALVKLEK